MKQTKLVDMGLHAPPNSTPGLGSRALLLLFETDGRPETVAMALRYGASAEDVAANFELAAKQMREKFA